MSGLIKGMDIASLTMFEPNKFSIDASEAGIKPGDRYPAVLKVETPVGILKFMFQHFDGNQTAIFRQVDGPREIRIFND